MKNSAMKFWLLLFFLLFVSINGTAQTDLKEDLPRGVVIKKVTYRNDGQSYVLYLPTNYTPEKKWAILYAFDPSAQGSTPVEIFRDAAEKYGFIVVGSNDSQNNLNSKKLSEIVVAFWTDTHAKFNIDEKRVYATGFSGGARIANTVAASCRGCIAGVIACGAGFSPEFTLDKPLPYSIFGAIGVDDFNYPELIKTFERLNKIGTPNRLDTFDGRHEWLTKELTFAALEWMNLQAIKSGRMAADESFVRDSLAKEMLRAQTFFQNGDILAAARIYETIVNDFKNIADTKAAAEKLADIKQQKSYKQAFAEEKKTMQQQLNASSRIIATGAELLELHSKNAALKRISDEMEIWRQQAKAATDSSQRKLARRILGQIFAISYQTAFYVNRPQQDYKTMIANLQLTRLVNPQNAHIAFELARVYALSDQKKDALEMLKQAAQNGFADCAQINNNAELAKLRSDKQFQKIIEQMNCQK